MKQIISIILVIIAINNVCAAQKTNRNAVKQKIYQADYSEPFQTPQKFSYQQGDYSFNVYLNSSWTFFGDESPKISVSTTNNNYKKETFSIKCKITQLPNKPLYTFFQETAIETEDSSMISFACNSLKPGIYKVDLEGRRENKLLFSHSNNIAYEPEKIDTQSGLGIFPNLSYISNSEAKKYTDSLASALKKLSGSRGYYHKPQNKKDNNIGVSQPSCKVLKIISSVSKVRDIFMVEISGSGKQKIKGYYFVPTKGEGYPTVIRFDYCKEGECSIKPDQNPNLIEFVVIDTPKEYYSKILAENEDNGKTNFIELCSDAFKIVDFIQSRSITNRDMIFTEGTGNGAVIALSLAAMDNRIGGCAIYNSNFSNEILNDSHFKLPLIAKSMNTPLLMEIELQDNSALNNFFIYNLVKGKKEYYLYTTPKEFNKTTWFRIENNFFEKYNRNR